VGGGKSVEVGPQHELPKGHRGSRDEQLGKESGPTSTVGPSVLSISRRGQEVPERGRDVSGIKSYIGS